MKLHLCLFALLFSFVLAAQINNPDFKTYTQNIPGTPATFKMVPVPAGTFTMGSNINETGRDDDEGPQTIFNISSFWMGQYEVTQEEFLSFTNDMNLAMNIDADAITRPSQPYIDFTPGMGKGGRFPANSMQQYGALMYCRWLYQKTGIFFRLPTEAEWEYAALGLINQNPSPSRKEGKRGEELITNKQVYSWAQNVNGLRDSRRGSWQGTFLANFKRGSGDNMGVAGGLNDRAVYTAPVTSFYPNGFGLYNMSGNVSEWVGDVYRPLSAIDKDDVAPFRGNKFSVVDRSTGKPERDSLGRIKMRYVTDEESKSRRNYQKGDVINYLDGDSLSMGVDYGYGVTTLISDSSRVIKGGSWNDRAYWLSPGTRRFLEEGQASSTVGFRCAMDRLGSPEGNGRKTGIEYKQRRQNNRKR